MNKKIISIIPAKSISRGLPGKNIKPLDGHPLLAYSIAASVQSKYIQRTICSTESREVADIAANYGAEIPFLRPVELTNDLTTDLEVFAHLLQWLKEKEEYTPDIIVQLRPTTPFRKAGWIDECIDLLLNNPNADSVRTVCEAPIHPYKMWKIENTNPFLIPLLKLEGVEEPYNMPRQILPKCYWQTATIDVLWQKTISQKNSMTGKNILPYFISPELAVDIDNIIDFKLAEVMIRENDLTKDVVRPK
ncbi:MAG: hypothetical protein ACD_79C00106G0003 [uncultured bacterium]|nr:MAG: hypothetical protein ACD_79C00106G0003 [uncultured bacterium]